MKDEEELSTGTCEVCGQTYTWGGGITGRRNTWCGKCQKTTSHLFTPKSDKSEEAGWSD